MKQIRKVLLTLACIAGGAILYSCGKDPKPETPPVETPDAETVSLKSTDNTQAFNLTHDKDGVHGTVEFNLTANLSNAVKDEITVKFTATCEGINSSKITLTPAEVKIKANSKMSQAVNVKITDWTELAATEEEKSYTVSVKISGVTGADYVSADSKAITATVKKAAKEKGTEPDPGTEPEPGDVTLTMETSLPEGYSYSRDNTAYTFKFWAKDGTSIVENPEENSVIGNGSSDVARDDGMICFEVDFTEVKNFSGLYFQHWGGSYCPQSSEVYYSDNGTDWKYIGKIENGATSTYYAMFSKVLSTRYIKYEMLEPSTAGRIDIRYFGLITKNE